MEFLIDMEFKQRFLAPVYRLLSKNSSCMDTLCILKTLLSFLLAVFVLCDLTVKIYYENTHPTAVDYIAGISQIIAYLCAMVLMQVERWNGAVASGVLFIYWLLSLLSGTVLCYNKVIMKQYETDILHFNVFLACYTFIVLEVVFHCFAEVPRKYDKKALQRKPNPELEASFPSKFTLHWITPLITKAFKNTLTEANLHQLNPRDNIKLISNKFFTAWNQEKAKCHQQSLEVSVSEESTDYKVVSKKPVSLKKVLLKVYLSEMGWAWVLKIGSDVLLFAGPVILDKLIVYSSNQEPEWKGYVLSMILFVLQILQSLFNNTSFFITMLLAMRIRGLLTSFVFRKMLTLNNACRQTMSMGHIVNTMSIDCSRFQEAIPFLYVMISSPIQISLSLYLLYQQLGASAFAGLVLLVFFIPVNGILMGKIKMYQAQQMKSKDIRIKLMNEILNGIKVIKLYAWEESLQKKINEIRKKEISLLRKAAYVTAVSTFLSTITPFAVTFVTFATYTLSSTSHPLTAQKAFVSLSLFNILRAPIELVPLFMSQAMQLTVAMKRLNKYLNSPDLSSDYVKYVTRSDFAIAVKDGTFTWNVENEDSFILKDINMEIKPGQLLSVVGTVGSGKSSLISTILGEMEKLKGSVEIQGSVAFVPQEAWIQNNTLKNNILFGKEYDQSMYDKVVEACALLADIDLLPDGSESEIGDKGVNLSGGQRQRISLARAVYNDADIYILDDPLSAVDSHVGKHIFNKVIGPNGLLKNKTRVLVTHGIHWLPEVDNIVVMNGGQISEMGNYNELVDHNGPFAHFLQAHLTQRQVSTESMEVAELNMKIPQRSNSRIDSTNSVQNDNEIDTAYENEKSMEETCADSSVRQWQKTSPFSKIFKSRGKSNSVQMNVIPSKLQNESKNKLIEKEKMSSGKVQLNVFKTYIMSIGLRSTIVGLSFYFCFQVFVIFSSIWLSWWSEDESDVNGTGTAVFNIAPENRATFYLGVYGGLGALQSFCVLCYSIIAAFSLLGGAKKLHTQLIANIIRCPMKFFDTTPLGRIINRFSKDIDTVDMVIPAIIPQVIRSMFFIITIIFLICYTTPTFLAALLPLVIVYYLIQRYFIPTSRQLKRIESVSNSPIYSLFGETVLGVNSIRAYRMQSYFINLFEDFINENLRAVCLLKVVERWLSIRIDLIGNITILCSAVFAIAFGASHGNIGLALSYAFSLSFNLGWFIRVRSDLEANIVSVERIREYCNIENEAAWVTDHRPDPSWPQEGNIDFENFDLRYRPGLELVLKGITCHIKGGEKIGIVGRTGAGKSSLTVSLFRLIEGAGGTIVIDNEPIDKLGLHDLRSRITILPQEPVLFSGSLRSNLDPLDQFSDADLWKALEVVHLKPFVEELSTKLDYECGENGSNLSVGQRQLVCLGRSVLKKTRILVLDEATAAVDMETDDLIQKTIRNEFKNTTILAIAHRLNTILDYDKIMVLEHGRVKEFASPKTLKKNKQSLFYALLKDAKLA
ncbi:resistance-associated 1-like isoform X1 [Octopus vulgaris]|uniref:ABC-type glutathione-S-conjugate transporter n=1 Tax=Octopus vulgaris TaxID=6645 RepID=A0AA36FI90_OCTVU|nr:resistance-associated 1-like isoform X1 [Octopus vulgaris]